MQRRLEQVGYRKFETSPVLQSGLLPIERDSGDLERRVAAGLARIADQFAQKAEQEAQIAGERAGQRDALAGAPGAATFSGGELTNPEAPADQPTASVNGQAGHVRKALPTDARGMRIFTGTAPEQAASLIRQEEGFRTTPYWDVNAWRIGYGSDTTVRADGRIEKVRPGMTIDKADAERDLVYRLTNREGARVRKQIGEEKFAALPTHVQAALISVGYNHGSLPGEVLAAVKTGDMKQVAASVASLPSNPERRRREAAIIAGTAAHILPADRDGPVKITPVREPLTITPGTPGNFRPTNSNSIFGRAYDVSGTRTWLQMAKMTIIEEQAQLYDKYKDDPATLQKAFGQLLEQHRRDGTYFDEVAPEYELSFRQNAFQLTQQAQAEAERRKKEQDQVDFLGRVSTLEDRKSQLLAGMDPRDDNSAAALSDMQSTIDSHYDSSVARGIMSPAEAERAKRASRSVTTVNYYLGQAKGLKTDELAALHETMRRDYAAGTLTGVTAEDWAKIDGGLSGAIQNSRTADDTADQHLAARRDDIFTRALRGEDLAPSDIARMRTEAQTAPHGDQIMASTDARMRLASALRTQPVTAVEANLEAILKGGGDKADPEDVAFAREKIEQVRKELATDPIGVAERFGVVPPAPPVILDGVADPAKLRDALAFRKGSAIAAAKHFGVPVKFFRPGEVDQLAQQAMQNPDQMVAFTLNVGEAFGKDTPRAMAEIAENGGQTMAHAVGVSIATGDASLARDVAMIGQMKARKEYPLKMPEGLSARGMAHLEGVLGQQPQIAAGVLSTAQALFEKAALEKGFDPATIKDDGSIAQRAYFRAIDRALGAQTINGVETGGIGYVNDLPIVVPALMGKSTVESLFYSINDEVLKKLPPIGTTNGVPVSARQIRDGYLISAGDGLYRVALTDPRETEADYLVGPDFQPWLLDIRQLEKLVKPETTMSSRFFGLRPMEPKQ